MTPDFTDDELREKAWEVLQQHLGPVDTMRFLSLLRRPRDYQKWRDDHFTDLKPEELFAQLREIESKQQKS